VSAKNASGRPTSAIGNLNSGATSHNQDKNSNGSKKKKNQTRLKILKRNPKVIASASTRTCTDMSAIGPTMKPVRVVSRKTILFIHNANLIENNVLSSTFLSFV